MGLAPEADKLYPGEEEREPKADTEEDVECPGKVGVAMREQPELHGKGGEGSKPAQEPGNDEVAHPLGKRPIKGGDFQDDTQRKTPENIDEED